MANILINFRLTAGYVTDGAGQTYVLGEVYPVTRGGWTFGWDTNRSGDARDRNNTTYDVRIAGINQNNADTAIFRVDLPSTGGYRVGLALGDINAQTNIQAVIKDNTTTKLTIGPTTISSENYIDALGTIYTDQTWPGSNQLSAELTFATTTFFLELTGSAGCIAHLRVQSVDAGPARLIFRNANA